MKPSLLALAAIAGLLAAGALRGQTYEASSFAGDRYHPRNAFDGDAASRWSAEFSERVGWIEVRWDEARTHDRVEIVAGTPERKGAPRDLRILAGEPGALEEVLVVRDNDADPVSLRFEGRKARVWRVEITGLIDARWSPSISEIRFGPEAAGAGAGASPADRPDEIRASDPGAAGRGPERVADGDPRSAWEARGKGKAWIEFAWTEPRTFDAVELDVRARGGYGVARDLALKVRDGSRWRTLFRREGHHGNRLRATFPEAKGKVWRLEIDAVVDERGTPRLGEMSLSKVGAAGLPPLPPTPLDERAVNRAIDRGVAWVKKKRAEDGNWKTSHTGEYPMGVMSLAGLALRKSGLDRDDPLLLELVRAVEAMPLKKTYSVALQALFLAAVSEKRHVARVQACADFLVESQAPDGLWGYPDGRSDLSNAQYALLALDAAARIGCRVPRKVFDRSLDYLLDGAEKDGGFNYVPHGRAARDPSTGSMTAAALACLALVRRNLPEGGVPAARCERVEKQAWAWIDERFTVDMNPGSPMSHHYWLYGVERLGAFFDRKEIGGRSWYADGAAHLLDWQRDDGSWHGDLVDTCFALLFLERASLTR